MPTNSKKTSKSPVGIKPSSLTVGKNVKITGEITDAKELSIDGIADIKVSTNKIIIGEKGLVKGQIEAADAQVRGALSGDIIASNTLTIYDKGSVSGKIAYHMLDIKLGGTIKGDISAIEDESKPLSKEPATKPLSNKKEEAPSIMELADKVATKK